MSERPSPYDAGLGPIASNPEKPDNFRRYLYGEPRKRFAGVMKETIFWRRIGEGLQPRVGLHLCLGTDEVWIGVWDGNRWWRLDTPPSPPSRTYKQCTYQPSVSVETFWTDCVPVMFAEWPEGPSTCNDVEE